MKWLKRNKFVILLLIFIVVIIVGYFTNLYSLIGINDWKDAASVVTIAGIIVGIFYYISAIKWNSYRYLADLYYKQKQYDKAKEYNILSFYPFQHQRGYFPRISPFFFPIHILSAQKNV